MNGRREGGMEREGGGRDGGGSEGGRGKEKEVDTQFGGEESEKDTHHTRSHSAPSD